MITAPFLAGWEPAAGMLKEELRQLAEEGRDPAWTEALVKKMGEGVDPAQLWAELQAAPILQDYAFDEPSDLPGIRAARTGGLRKKALSYSNEVLRDRMHGAWLGRCCGCALGKPVELFMSASRGLSSRERIKVYLEETGKGEYPLQNYFRWRAGQGDQESVICQASTRESIAFMESDDDIRYTVIGQRVLLEKGADFTTRDVMETWMSFLPYHQLCTAETQSARNYIMRYQRGGGPGPEIDWAWVALHQNPYREWIGAQIRADSWGYAAPGNPELAADFAWRDARMSHVKNGIYGEMFVAAMIAASFVLDDMLEVVEAGLAEIPQTSRLYRDMKQTVAICRAHGCDPAKFEAVFEKIYELLGHYHPVHTNNNAALVVAALLLGGADFEKVITIAVMGGWDSDCNGATAGSIFGARYGAGRIPGKWKEPLHDTLFSEVRDYHPIAISECARKSFEIAQKIGSAS